MNRSDLPSLMQRVMLMLIAIGAMVGMLVTLQRASAVRVSEAPAPLPPVVPPDPGPPIRSEAEVFATRPGMEAVAANTVRRPYAHPRTLRTYRSLRSYPGAPPRVPHGLTSVEFRTNRCNTCHEKGGYSLRFNAYTPVNPHPQWLECLQCHATNDQLVGVPFPEASPEAACRQCHTGNPSRFEEAGLDWKVAAWPTVAPDVTVPPIPHDLTTRGNCLACHMGPSAVAEIRTTHPERTNCRQCHVELVASRGDAFVRPGSASVDRSGGMP